RCMSAARFPTTIVKATDTARAVVSQGATSGKTVLAMRTSAAKAPALTTTLMNVVTVVGAPVYTSGAHWWNGASDALNDSPAITSPAPSVAREATEPWLSAAITSA